MSGVPSRVFVARLAGIAVFDPAGDRVGRVRDIVVALRVGGRPPRVLGLVVEVQVRRPVFLPITRVEVIEADAIIFDGRLNVRRFQQRASETLVIAEMLDRRVRLVEGGEGVSVVDVAMEQTRTRDWLLTKVAVRRDGRGLRRRGEVSIVDWGSVTGFSATEYGQGAAGLIAAFEQTKPADMANIIRELPDKRRAEVAAALDDERLADVLEELPEDDQAEILERLEPERSARVLDVMDPDDATDLLAELPAERREQLLALMRPEEADPVRRLLRYADDTAGGMMTTDPVIMTPAATVADALAQIRNPDLDPTLAAQVYVCRPPTETPTGRYLGTVHFQRLLREPPATLVGGLADTELEPLPPTMPLEAVSAFLATYNLVASAVVDHDGHLLGAVTIDDVLDHLLPGDWREGVMEAAAGMRDGRPGPGEPAAGSGPGSGPEEEALRGTGGPPGAGDR